MPSELVSEKFFWHLQEQWKSSTPGSKRRDRSEMDDDEGANSEKRRRKGGKKRRKEKSSKSHYEMEETEADMMDDLEELEDEDVNVNDGEHRNQRNDHDENENAEENAQELLAAAGLEDSDAEDEAVRIFKHLSAFIYLLLLTTQYGKNVIIMKSSCIIKIRYHDTILLLEAQNVICRSLNPLLVFHMNI